MQIFGRDPAVILGFVSAFLQMLIAYGVHLSDGQTAAINAIAAAVLGLLTAVIVARDRLIPAILGIGQAGFTLALVFGANLSQRQVATTMAVAAVALALFARTQVTAPVAADGSRVPRPARKPRVSRKPKRPRYGRAA